MQKELALVEKFHRKFKVPVSKHPTLISVKRSSFRYNLILEEIREYQSDGVNSSKIENIAKELADILYTVYGTVLEHGLQDKMEEIFKENHNSQMSKEYAKYKMVKGDKYFEADINTILKK